MKNYEKTIKKILIVGLPNTGKSLIFTNLTGKFTLIANSPLTTIDIKRASIEIENQVYEIIDTPGLHNIFMHSEEELIVMETIFIEQPDIILQCIDANRLKQSLTLTVGLLKLGIPLVITLNAIDETTRKGIWIDSKKLSYMLGVPVVESMAIYVKGTKEIIEAFSLARIGKLELKYGDIIEDGISAISSILPINTNLNRCIALLTLMNDSYIYNYLDKICTIKEIDGIKAEVEKIKFKFKGNIIRTIDNARSRWIDNIFETVIRKQKVTPVELSEVFAKYSRHPIFGIPILLCVLLATYYLVANVANSLSEFMNKIFWIPIESAINSIFPKGVFLHDFLIGHYGILSMGVANALLTILPILSVFFLIFNILEDTGYIPNLSVLSKRLLSKLGLSGSAILPLILGFGCKTMAAMTTRTLKSKRERFIAIYLISFAIPCAAQMGLNISILGRIGFKAFITAFSILIFVEILAGLILNKILKEEDEKKCFILELPPIRLPNVRLVLKKTYYRLYWFLKETFMVFIYAAVILFVIDKIGILLLIKKILGPLIEDFLGLPISMADAVILSLARREVGAGLIINLIKNGQMNYIQCIVAVIFTSMSVPCFANIMAIVKELGIKKAILIVISINLSAFIASGLLNRLLLTIL